MGSRANKTQLSVHMGCQCQSEGLIHYAIMLAPCPVGKGNRGSERWKDSSRIEPRFVCLWGPPQYGISFGLQSVSQVAQSKLDPLRQCWLGTTL